MDTAHYRIELPDAVAGGWTLPVTLGCDARFVVDRIAVPPSRICAPSAHREQSGE